MTRASSEASSENSLRLLPVSLKPPTDSVLRRCLRVLSMVAELHKAGYQRLRISTGMSPSGMYWRCLITTADNIAPNGWEPIDWDYLSATYTSGVEDRYFGWDDAPGKNARQLAQMFIERFPHIATNGAGRDRAYIGWYVEILGRAEAGDLPVFYADWPLNLPEDAYPPPPLGIISVDREKCL